MTSQRTRFIPRTIAIGFTAGFSGDAHAAEPSIRLLDLACRAKAPSAGTSTQPACRLPFTSIDETKLTPSGCGHQPRSGRRVRQPPSTKSVLLTDMRSIARKLRK